MIVTGIGRPSSIVCPSVAAGRPRPGPAGSAHEGESRVATRPKAANASAGRGRVASLFSGIGGLDLGLEQAGYATAVVCDKWEPAQKVLAAHWPDVELADDVLAVSTLPSDITGIAAGFPCTNLSLAGAQEGIDGPASRLVSEVLRLARTPSIDWVLLENVKTLLAYGGAPMRIITAAFVQAGFSWAYRLVDARFAGLPQRRPRVVLLAARTFKPEDVLLTSDAGPPDPSELSDDAWGFYWTEGRRGLGWTQDAIPPLKGGSTIGLPSAPAVWFPNAPHGHRLVIPSIEQGEQLQGFPAGWTSADADKPSSRWKLVGNAVAVPVAQWIARSMAAPGRFTPPTLARPIRSDRSWPHAGWGNADGAWSVNLSAWPERSPYTHLSEIVDWQTASPLSHKAARGFTRRLTESRLTPLPAFVADLHIHLAMTRPPTAKRPPVPRHAKTTSSSTTAGGTTATSWASDGATRNRMRANKRSDTAVELQLRSALHRRGVRFRVQQHLLDDRRRSVDIVLPAAKIAIDVRGCYWHACPDDATLAKSNAAYWVEKFHRNVERDTETEQALRSAGWEVHVVWEHEDPDQAADRIYDRLVQLGLKQPLADDEQPAVRGSAG